MAELVRNIDNISWRIPGINTERLFEKQELQRDVWVSFPAFAIGPRKNLIGLISCMILRMKDCNSYKLIRVFDTNSYFIPDLKLHIKICITTAVFHDF